MTLDCILLTVISFLLSSITCFAATSFEDDPKDIWTSIFSTIQVAILSVTTLNPKRSVNRFYFGLFLFTGQLVATTFLAFYYIFLMRSIYMQQIDTFEQIADKDFLLAGDGNTRDYLMEMNRVNFGNSIISTQSNNNSCILFWQLSTSQIESFIVCANFSYCLKQLEQNEHLAVAVSRQYARTTTSAPKNFCFTKSNNIRNYTVGLLMRAKRVHIDEWNKLIQRVIEAGLIKQWSENTRYKESARQPELSVIALKPEHLYSTFILTSVALTMSIVVFIFERVIHRNLQDENTHRFWRTADWIIDGKRHKFIIPLNQH